MVSLFSLVSREPISTLPQLVRSRRLGAPAAVDSVDYVHDEGLLVPIHLRPARSGHPGPAEAGGEAAAEEVQKDAREEVRLLNGKRNLEC